MTRMAAVIAPCFAHETAAAWYGSRPSSSRGMAARSRLRTTAGSPVGPWWLLYLARLAEQAGAGLAAQYIIGLPRASRRLPSGLPAHAVDEMIYCSVDCLLGLEAQRYLMYLLLGLEAQGR